MTRPEDALPAARAAAEAAKARGEYTSDLAGFAIEPTDRISIEQLMEWAVIEPDASLMRSTRRYGAPITWLKRLLLRGMQQHFNELTMLQARYNMNLLMRLTELQDRVADLERETTSWRDAAAVREAAAHTAAAALHDAVAALDDGDVAAAKLDDAASALDDAASALDEATGGGPDDDAAAPAPPADPPTP
ncbi:hypothetical protein DSM112329_04983 [Paraconexibacter sp. AEG42_29]|uniref:Uncharacterized protein n=1 Tax=Paraconexibacter sp. AEG42_29 TaxID=2997339 RepID=A0AAU7B342_9ACTN